jgi:hypothetical protein
LNLGRHPHRDEASFGSEWDAYINEPTIRVGDGCRLNRKRKSAIVSRERTQAIFRLAKRHAHDAEATMKE